MRMHILDTDPCTVGHCTVVHYCTSSATCGAIVIMTAVTAAGRPCSHELTEHDGRQEVAGG